MILLLNMDLLPGQQMIINTRYLMMMEYSCTIEIQNVKRIKNRFFLGMKIFLIQLLLVLVKLFFKHAN